jgi:hypothetical protein
LLGSAAFSKIGEEARKTFREAPTQIIADVPMTVLAVEIDKRRLTQRYRIRTAPTTSGFSMTWSVCGTSCSSGGSTRR